MNELKELVKGLDRIDAFADRTLIAMQGDTAVVKKIPVVYMDGKCHSCNDSKNCRLNTSNNPFACMIKHDDSDLEIEE